MANICTDAGDNQRIQFVDGQRKRRSIALGKLPLDEARKIKACVGKLNAAAVSRGRLPLDRDTAEWLAGVDAELHAKLADVGLVPERSSPERHTLGPFIDAYIATRSDIKSSTKNHLKWAGDKLVEFFGASRPLAEITPGDADEFCLQARRKAGRKLSANTVRRLCARSMQFFRAAARKRLIADSAFADMKRTSARANRDREHFISRDVAQRVIDACPDPRSRLLFALSRYGGLRCPSEYGPLRWGDINWEHGRMRVTSPKTAHHEGKGERWVPIFPELRPHLEAAFEAAADGRPGPGHAEFVITPRATKTQMRTQLERIIARAGVEQWPKLFQNLRHAANGTGRRVSESRGVRMDGQQSASGARALFASDGRTFRARRRTRIGAEFGAVPPRTRR